MQAADNDAVAVFRFAHFHLAQLIEALCIHGGKSLGHMLCDDHAGNIGILGVDKRGEEAFQITLGGSSGDNASVGQILGSAMSEDETVDAIARIIDVYLVRRTPGERFIETYRRLGAAPFKDAAYATV